MFLTPFKFYFSFLCFYDRLLPVSWFIWIFYRVWPASLVAFHLFPRTALQLFLFPWFTSSFNHVPFVAPNRVLVVSLILLTVSVIVRVSLLLNLLWCLRYLAQFTSSWQQPVVSRDPVPLQDMKPHYSVQWQRGLIHTIQKCLNCLELSVVTSSAGKKATVHVKIYQPWSSV
jgi:hypothetical protein